jgi:hypothetical protein
MAFCWRHTSITLIEIAWRWLFGIPFLLLAWAQAAKILLQLPPATAGLDRVELENPWLSSVLLADAIGRYQPLVLAVLHWLLPLAVAAWAVVSAIGRLLVLTRMQTLDPISTPIPHRGKIQFLRRLPGAIVLQALWMLALLLCFGLWYRAVGWASSAHITSAAQPDLVGYLCWLIFFSLAFYTLWALLSWPLATATLLLFLDEKPGTRAPLRALMHSFTQGRELSSKLMEVSLVLAIVRIMLLVLAMVFSAAPLPFADEFGPDTLHALYLLVAVAYLIANDYFHVVRLRSFRELWRSYRRNNLVEKKAELATDPHLQQRPQSNRA